MGIKNSRRLCKFFGVSCVSLFIMFVVVYYLLGFLGQSLLNWSVFSPRQEDDIHKKALSY